MGPENSSGRKRTVVEQGRMQLGPDTEMLMPEGKLQTSSGASSINRDH